jgi:16S rRNA C967 or C1407 C5-methylase (RsmB/RsmF family)
MVDDSFKKDLDELFRLFKKMVENKNMDDIPGVDKFMLQQFQMFFNNYDTMKDQIADQLHGQFGDSVKDMVRSLVEQLKEELGEDDLLRTDEEELPPPVSIDHVKNDIQEIDEMLKNPDLTEEQIDELLDRRANLQN